VTQLSEKQRKVVRPLLGASLLLCSCSLSTPAEGELFAPDRPSVDQTPASTVDAGADADEGLPDQAADAGESEQGRDSGAVRDAESDSTPASDGGDLADATADAGPTIFDPEAGLVVHYRFNESTGNTVHDFAGDNDALVVGTPEGHEQWVAAGRIDGALKLAGGAPPEEGTGHHVELPQGVLLGLDEASIALWVNRSGGPMWQRVFDFGSGQPVWLFFTPYGGTGLPVVAGRTPALIFVDFVPIADAPEGQGELTIHEPIPVSTWVHFVLTWSAQEVKVYLDGELVGQTVTHGAITPSDLGNTGQNYLGRSQFATDPYFDGLLDDFRIYDRVLSASDVAKLHDTQ
jgi:hypothetical protein